MGPPNPNGVVMNIPEDYKTAFKGGRRGQRRKNRPVLKNSVRQTARQLLNSRSFTARDEAILETLFGIGLLSRNQIQRLFWAGSHPNTVAKRLRILYERHLLNYTPDLLDRMRTSRLEPCHIYGLAEVGEEILAVRRGLTRSRLGLGQRYDLQRGNPLLMHDLQVSEVYVKARIAVGQYAGQLAWYNEKAAAIRTQAGEELVRPDGALQITLIGAVSTYFLEMDRGSTHWPNKVDFYEHAQRSGDSWSQQFYTSEFPPVLAVVPNRLLGKASKVIRQQARTVRFWIKTWPAFLDTDFLRDWSDTITGNSVNLIPEGGLAHGRQ